MVFDKLFNQSRILETAMQATAFKNDVLLGNIANADTPNYKRKTVEFEGALEKAINKTKQTGINQMGEVMENIKVTEFKPSVTLDGNSVDIETEMINFYKNSTKYDVIVNSVMGNSNIKNTIYQTFK